MNWNKVILNVICHYLLPIDIIILGRANKQLHRITKSFIFPAFRKRVQEKFHYILHKRNYIYGSFILYVLAGIPYNDIDINSKYYSDRHKLYKQVKKDYKERYGTSDCSDEVSILDFGHIQLILHQGIDFPEYILKTDMDICMNYYTENKFMIKNVEAIQSRKAKVLNITNFSCCVSPISRVYRYRKKGFEIKTLIWCLNQKKIR